MQVDPVRLTREVRCHQGRIAGDEVSGGGHVDPALQIEVGVVDAGIQDADPRAGGPELPWAQASFA
jgi:hypothetical protein